MGSDNRSRRLTMKKRKKKKEERKKEEERNERTINRSYRIKLGKDHSEVLIGYDFSRKGSGKKERFFGELSNESSNLRVLCFRDLPLVNIITPGSSWLSSSPTPAAASTSTWPIPSSLIWFRGCFHPPSPPPLLCSLLRSRIVSCLFIQITLRFPILAPLQPLSSLVPLLIPGQTPPFSPLLLRFYWIRCALSARERDAAVVQRKLARSSKHANIFVFQRAYPVRSDEIEFHGCVRTVKRYTRLATLLLYRDVRATIFPRMGAAVFFRQLSNRKIVIQENGSARIEGCLRCVF